MARQALVPGGAYLNETGTLQALVPGQGFLNETISIPPVTIYHQAKTFDPANLTHAAYVANPPWPITAQVGFKNWLAIFPVQVQPPLMAAYTYFSHYSTDEVLNLPVPFLPRLPDIAPSLPPLPQASVSSPIFSAAVVTILSWLPWVASVPPVMPSDRQTFFSPIFPLNFKLPWLSRTIDAAPQTQADKPNFFSPILAIVAAVTSIPWFPSISNASPITAADKPSFFGFPLPLNFKLPWLPRISEAIPQAPADKPTFFSPVMAIAAVVQSWFPRTTDPVPLTPPDKASVFSPPWLINFRLPWLPRMPDTAPPVAPLPQAGLSSPLFSVIAATILSWFPVRADAPPVTPPDKPNYFAPRWLLKLPIPWLSKISTDAPPLTPADKPSFFAPPWVLNFKLPWLPRVVDAAPVAKPDKPTSFMPSWKIAAFSAIGWYPRISHAEPPSQLPPEGITVVPGTLLSTITGALLYPFRRKTTLYPKLKNVILSPYRGFRRRKYDDKLH